MKKAHLHFRIGNIIKAPDGGLWIVSEVDDDVMSAVSFDMSNYTATQQMDDHERRQRCHCGDDFDGNSQGDCKDCHGKGHYTVKVRGWRHSKIVAETAKDFIMKGVKRTFRIE